MFGFDFNPAADRIRVVSNTGQNLRLHPDTGAVVDGDATVEGVQPDPSLRYAWGDVNARRRPDIAGATLKSNRCCTPFSHNVCLELFPAFFRVSFYCLVVVFLPVILL